MLKNILSVAATALAVSAMLAVSANTAFAESTKKAYGRCGHFA